jgi:DNA-binding MarR family transcriptional regulator
MEEMPIYLEDEEEEEEDWQLKIRHEVIEFVLRRFGLLSASDIARALNWKVGEINHALRELERSGRVKRTRLGRAYVWTHVDEYHTNKMYY